MAAIMTVPGTPVMTGASRRQVIAAAALVGAVVLALGVGSGLGLVVSERRVEGSVAAVPAAAAPPAQAQAPPAQAQAPPAPAVVPPAPVVLGEVPIVASEAAHPGPSGPPTLVRRAPVLVAPAVEAAPVPADSSAAVLAPAAVSCVADPMGTFTKHIQGAHLETSPGQQVTDLLDLNKYTLTHTLLVNNMLFGSC